jgi:tetratricopeptide (TPR) repeat protein
MTVEERRYRPARRDAAAAAVRRVLVDAPGLPAQALVLAVLLYLAAADGGYYAVDWYPAGLVVLVLVGLWAALVPPRPAPRRLAVAATALFVAFGVWALVSIAWADEASAAWDGGNRALMYAALFGLFSLWPVPAAVARWLVALAGIGIAAIGLVELIRWSGSADPDSFLLGNRFSEPVGYQNGDVALWLMGALACLWAATVRELPAVLRGLALGAVPLLGSLAWLGQSRGSLFALPVAGLVFLAIVPGRLRLIAALVPCALAVAVSIEPALDVVDASREALPPLVDDVARAILIPAAVVALLGFLAALLDRRWTPGPAAARRISAVAAAVVAVAVVAGLGVAGTQAGELRSDLSERWDQFKSSEYEGSGSARLSSGGTNRYDFWTVAWDTFQREPLRGVGMDNFQQDYALRGKSLEKPRYPHSLELAVLSETGVVGALLLLAGLLTALAAAFAARRRLAPLGAAGPGMAAAGVFAYLFLHTSVDWQYELPALGGLAFAFLGLAAGVTASTREPGARSGRSRPTVSRAGRIAVPVAAALVAVSFALPWLAEREIDQAIGDWRTSPQDAYDSLDRAATLNPLSVTPLLYEGGIAALSGDAGRASRAYLEAVDQEPRNSSAWLQLAVLAQVRQDRRDARRYARRAARLAPRDEATKAIRARIAAGSEISAEQANRILLKYARGASE